MNIMHLLTRYISRLKSKCGFGNNIEKLRRKVLFHANLPVNFVQQHTNMASSDLPSVLVTRVDIPEVAIKLLSEKCVVDMWNKPGMMPREALLKQVQNKNGIFCFFTDKIDAEVLDAAGPSLKAIGTMSVGYDHIDLKECKKRNISVGNTPDVLTDATAELGVSLLLATSRRLIEAAAAVTNNGWFRASFAPLWMCGTSLKDKTVGIIGMGRIGFAVAQRLKPFKVSEFLYFGNTPKKYAEEIDAKFVTFDELLEKSDFVVLCCSLNTKTKGLINAEALKKMKSSAILINISRGAVVDQDALYDALTTGQITAAGLDVMSPEPFPVDHPLTKLDNCVLLPHIGSAAYETRYEMATLTAENIICGIQNKPLPASL